MISSRLRKIVLLSGCATCASAQSADSVSENLSVSRGSISKLVKTLLFLSFQMYHRIYAKWWSSIFGITVQNRRSMFAKREQEGKIVGFDGILERAQTWRAGGHSKNTRFIDSSEAPHRAQHISPCNLLTCKFFLTDIHPDTNCHKKMLYLRWAPYLPTERFQYIDRGPIHHWCLFPT